MGAGSLRIFFFSDWRIQPLPLAERMLAAVAPVDVVLYGGDDVARLTMSAGDHFPGREQAHQRLMQRCARQRRLKDEQRDLAQAGYWFGDPQELVGAAARLLKRQPTRSLRAAGNRVHVGRVLELFAPETATHWLAKLAAYSRFGVGAVIGNDCFPEHAYRLAVAGVNNLHSNPIRAGAWGIAGLEGAISHTSADGTVNGIGHCLTTDDTVVQHLEAARLTLGVDADHLVIVSHTPPARSLDLAIRFGFRRVGSPSLAAYIDEHHPPLVLCGHCHSCGGRHLTHGNTLVVNAACSDRDAKVAPACLIEMDSDSTPRLTWVDPTPHSVLYFPDVGKVREGRLRSVGITRTSELLKADEEALRSAGFGRVLISRVRGRALADSLNTAVRLIDQPFQVPEPLIHFDVETGLGVPGEAPFFLPEPQQPWMIATKLAGEAEVHQWVAPDDDAAVRREMYEEFIAFLRLHPDATLCSWTNSGFDAGAVATGLALWCPHLLEEWRGFAQFSPFSQLRKRFALPARDWKLDTVARFCGFAGPSEDMDGFRAGALYELYRRFGEPLPVDLIARYNVQDVRSVEHVVTWFARQASELPQVAPVARRRTARPTSRPVPAGKLAEFTAQAPPGFRICPRCGKCFFPRYRLQTYCGKQCRTDAQDWRRAQRRVGASG